MEQRMRSAGAAGWGRRRLSPSPSLSSSSSSSSSSPSSPSSMPMLLPSSPLLLLLLIASCCLFQSAHGQIYTFEKEPLPASKSLRTMYAFYVYSHKEAPDQSLGQPFVKFHSLEVHSTGATPDMELASYDGLQLSILRFRDFWNLIDPNRFCSVQADVDAKLAEAPDQLLVSKPPGVADEDVNLYSHTVRFYMKEKDVQLPVHSTGVYILIYSNCGSYSEGLVSGSVIVKNAYGFLPGNEYHKMPFYGWMSFIYIVLAAIWMGLSLRWWRETVAIQYCIAAVIFLGLLEATVWWMFFNDWNSTGTRGRFLFIFAILTSVVKSVFSYMLVLVASLGWGVTRPYLDHKTIVRVQILSFLYIVLDFVRESVLSYRFSHSLSAAFIVLCLIPVALLNGVIFYWIFTALSSLMETLQQRKQSEKLLLFQRLWNVIVGALILASCSILFQLFDLSKTISMRWHHQWFFADGVSHILFLAVLVAMMFLWAPGYQSSQRFSYTPAAVADSDEESNKKGDIWAEDDLDEEEEGDESFWASTRKPAAETI
eukprot:CAMPEP_0206541042 /NCGR_PEP_ID=MMETSP0325_2-20121206/9371_1 /ASSEMBLY_ACC=CAM_ASM_000347 /TAXON_ID=2866 /ORGANISM="Crypthecodinium cohnii, Strain Seligo" /LENGTH=539 /DNA_ID=CAMNT_0054038893 /DNA_START=220 /DNA_END=1836 /DNA_ORIENTATION=-